MLFMHKSTKYDQNTRVKWMPHCMWAFAAGAIAMLPAFVAAQGFPTKPVTVIYPFPPGNPAENKLRVMYAEAAKTLGQPIVTEYRPGAGGRLGVVAVQKAPPDGYLLSFATDSVLTVASQASPTFHPQVERDYVAIHAPYAVSLTIVSHPSRSPLLPNVPTLKELGYDVSAQSWTAIIGPPGLPAETVNRLNTAFNAAQKTPEIAKMLASDDSYVSLATPQAITTQIKSAYDKMGPLVKRLNLKFD